MPRLRTLLFTSLLAIGPDSLAYAHSWYPKQCCSGEDCAPVIATAQSLPASGGVPHLIVTSKHGKAVVPASLPVRESHDGRMHVCMRYDSFGAMEVICLFVPPDV